MRTNYLRWDAGQVNLTERDADGGWQTAQVNTYGDGGTAPMLYHAPYGMMGRPLDPGDDGACQALYAYEGDQGHIWPTLDTRALGKLPALKKGGSVVYDSAGSFGVFDPEEHTHTLYVPVEFDDSGTPTKAHAITVGRSSDGSALLSIVHADGMALVMQSDVKHSVVLKSSDGSTTIVLDDDGGVLSGAWRVAGGVVAGSTGAKPLAQVSPGLLSYLAGLEAAIAALGGTVTNPAAVAAASFTATMASST